MNCRIMSYLLFFTMLLTACDKEVKVVLSLLLTVPVGELTTPETRLVKWMFTAVVLNPDGSDALEGIHYSLDKKIMK